MASLGGSYGDFPQRSKVKSYLKICELPPKNFSRSYHNCSDVRAYLIFRVSPVSHTNLYFLWLIRKSNAEVTHASPNFIPRNPFREVPRKFYQN